MNEFKIIDTITFNNKNFKILLNENKHLIYMLEITEDGKFIYPTFEDYSEYLKIQKLNENPTIFDFDIDKEIEYEIKNNKNRINIIPKIIYKGVLISLTSALLLTGCAKQSNADAISTTDVKDSYTIQLETECDNLGYEIDYTSFGTPYVTKQFILEYGADTKKCKNIEEFRSEIGDSNTYTYADIKECFKNNESIPDNYKEFLYNGLDNMEKELPNLDLTVLHYNAERLKFVNTDNITSGNTKNIAAQFNMLTKEVYYNNEIAEDSSFIVCHEILGHGAMECLAEKDYELIYYGFYTTTVNYEEKYYALEDTALGKSYSEGAANIIARIATQSDRKSIYNYAEEELRLIGNMCDLSTEDLLNKRGIGLIEEMHSHGIDDPFASILESDTILKNYHSDRITQIKDNNQISSLLENIIIDGSEEKIAHDETSLDDIKKMMDDSVFENGFALRDPNNEEEIIDEYNPDESFENVKEELTKSKNL